MHTKNVESSLKLPSSKTCQYQRLTISSGPLIMKIDYQKEFSTICYICCSLQRVGNSGWEVPQVTWTNCSYEVLAISIDCGDLY